MIDKDYFIDALRAVDQQTTQFMGWDFPPMLMQLVRDGEPGPMPEMSLEATGVRLPPGEHGKHLVRMAAHMAKSPERAQQVADAAPDTIGLALYTCSWAFRAPSEQYYAYLATGGKAQEHPDAYEARDLTVVDVWGRIFHVHAAKGGETWCGQEEIENRGGRIPASLASMLKTLAPHLGYSSEPLENLLEMFRRHAQDIAEKVEAAREER